MGSRQHAARRLGQLLRNPSNYYLYNSGRHGAEHDFMGAPYLTFIPWDYDNCLGIDYSSTKWQYTNIVTGRATPGTTGGSARPLAYR